MEQVCRAQFRGGGRRRGCFRSLREMLVRRCRCRGPLVVVMMMEDPGKSEPAPSDERAKRWNRRRAKHCPKPMGKLSYHDRDGKSHSSSDQHRLFVYFHNRWLV